MKCSGSRCLAARLDDATDQVVELVRRGEGGYVSTCNVHVVVTACHDQAYHDTLTAASLRLADGWPVAWVQRRQGAKSAQRVPGPDLMEHLLEQGSEDGFSHFLLGSTSSVLQRLESQIAVQYPDVRIAGTESPPFGEVPSHPDSQLVDRIRGTAPSVVWVGLGAPKQDFWMRLYAEALAPSVLIGVGAAFDFLAGARPRAPLWMRQCGLEWAHRLASEPRRLTPRYVRTNTEFILRGAADMAKRGPER